MARFAGSFELRLSTIIYHLNKSLYSQNHASLLSLEYYKVRYIGISKSITFKNSMKTTKAK
jgi:hypothetical protein